jgi:hypothetical protein
MRTDPTIERIRKIRHEISDECNHDTRKMVEYYMKYQQKYANRLLKGRVSPKTIHPKTEAEKI